MQKGSVDVEMQKKGKKINTSLFFPLYFFFIVVLVFFFFRREPVVLLMAGGPAHKRDVKHPATEKKTISRESINCESLPVECTNELRARQLAILPKLQRHFGLKERFKK